MAYTVCSQFFAAGPVGIVNGFMDFVVRDLITELLLFMTTLSLSSLGTIRFTSF